MFFDVNKTIGSTLLDRRSANLVARAGETAHSFEDSDWSTRRNDKSMCPMDWCTSESPIEDSSRSSSFPVELWSLWEDDPEHRQRHRNVESIASHTNGLFARSSSIYSFRFSRRWPWYDRRSERRDHPWCNHCHTDNRPRQVSTNSNQRNDRRENQRWTIERTDSNKIPSGWDWYRHNQMEHSLDRDCNSSNRCHEQLNSNPSDWPTTPIRRLLRLRRRYRGCSADRAHWQMFAAITKDWDRHSHWLSSSNRHVSSIVPARSTTFDHRAERHRKQLEHCTEERRRSVRWISLEQRERTWSDTDETIRIVAYNNDKIYRIHHRINMSDDIRYTSDDRWSSRQRAHYSCVIRFQWVNLISVRWTFADLEYPSSEKRETRLERWMNEYIKKANSIYKSFL